MTPEPADGDRVSRRDLRLVPVALTSGGAAWAATHVPQLAGPSSVVAFAVALLVIVVAARARSRATAGTLHTVLSLAVVSLGVAGSIFLHVAGEAPARDAAADAAVRGGRAVEVTAIVTGKVEPGGIEGVRFDAVAESIAIGDTLTTAGVPIEIHVDPATITAPTQTGGAVAAGARVRARGSAISSEAGERATFVVIAREGLEVVQPAHGVLALAADLRSALVGAARGLPAPAGGLIPGLAIGDTSAVTAALDTEMKVSSLAHLTAVSGANCALVVVIAFAAAASLGATRAVRVVLALTALGGFVVLVTPEPSVVRAAVMAAIAMLAVLLGRAGAGVSTLCLAVAVILVSDPWLASSIGFALSVAATGALLMLAAPLAAGMQRWMPRSLALALAVPLSAQLVCGPILVLITPHVSLYGVAANLIAAPAAPLATIVGLAGCLAAPIPVLQSGLTALAWVPAAWIASTAHAVSALPAAQLDWIGGLGGLLTLAGVGAAVAVLVMTRHDDRTGRIARAASGAVLAASVGVCGALALLAGPVAVLALPAGWGIAACDVGQGDAVLLRSPPHVALVDTGPDPDVLARCLRRFAIERIDLLVLTHFDLDHAGGTDALVGRVGLVVHGPPTSPAHEQILDDLAGGGASLRAGTTGVSGRLGTAQWRILWPPPRSVAFPGGNDASVVLDIRGGGVPSTVLLGDLSAAPQRAIVRAGLLTGPYDVVKVAHHGSADQEAQLYTAIAPAIAVISVGADNDYGHPRATLLDILQRTGARIARTDTDGVVVVSLRERRLEIWRERAPPPGVDGAR